MMYQKITAKDLKRFEILPTHDYPRYGFRLIKRHRVWFKGERRIKSVPMIKILNALFKKTVQVRDD